VQRLRSATSLLGSAVPEINLTRSSLQHEFTHPPSGPCHIENPPGAQGLAMEAARIFIKHVYNQTELRSIMRRFILAGLLSAIQIVCCATDLPSRNDRVSVLAKDAQYSLGHRKMDLLQPHELIVDALLTSLGVPDEQTGPEPIAPNVFAVGGCRPHSCDEKAFSIVDMAENKVLLAAIRHFHCHFEQQSGARKKDKRPVSCDASPTISIFLFEPERRSSSSVTEENLLNHAREWGRRFDPAEVQIVRVKAGAGK